VRGKGENAKQCAVNERWGRKTNVCGTPTNAVV